MIRHNKLEGMQVFTSGSWCLASGRTLAVVGVAIGVLWTLGLARAQGEIESLLPGIVKIVAGPATKTGTGFVVARSRNDTFIVTAAHVVEGADRISVFFYDRPSRAVPGTASRIEAGDPRGLALITVSEAVAASVTLLPLASGVKLSRGEAVKGVGHQASHGDWGVISGDVASRQGSSIRIQAPVEQQTSGGPVIRDGRVVGMFVSQQPNVGIAITALAVRDYLDGALPPGVQAAAEMTSEKPPRSETTEKPAPPSTPEKRTATDTRRIVVDGPKPLYAPFKTGDVFQECAECPEMVVVPAGEFMMGSPPGTGDGDERPQRMVTIARPFAVSKYEITFDEWDACVAAGGCRDTPDDWGWGRGRRPVINVNWDNAQAYAAWLAKKTGKPYRLLSEAEWEYAARGGTTTRYPWGDEPGTNRANLIGSGSRWSGKQTAPVGSFEPNAFGLHDMIGNVWEWVEDCWNESYRGAPVDGRAWGAGDCGRRVVRGGSWNNEPGNARVADRFRYDPALRDLMFGFRLARTL